MSADRLRLGVNIDHIATLRQARGTRYPEPVHAACIAIDNGADQITIHLREDRRHIQERDLALLRDIVQVPLNLEMAPTPEMVKIALRYLPDIVTLVPERREERTTEGGLDVIKQIETVRSAIQQLGAAGIVVSLFIAADPVQVRTAASLRAPVIELHTGDYCEARTAAMRAERLAVLRTAAVQAHGLGLRVAAGHGLDYRNVREVATLPHVEELNIGHSIVARALFCGFGPAVREMADLLRAPCAS